MGIGQITKEHFENVPLRTMGRDVILERAEMIEDARGDKTISYGNKEPVRVVFLVRTHDYSLEEAGKIKKAPAYMLSKISDGIKKEDKITIDFKTWKVRTAINRNGVFIYSDIYLWEDTLTDEEDLTQSSTAGNIGPRREWEDED